MIVKWDVIVNEKNKQFHKTLDRFKDVWRKRSELVVIEINGVLE